MSEFALIDRIRMRVAARQDVVLGIGDDAALLQLPPGEQLVVTSDTLNSGVHFPAETLPADIGWKALAVNLSDLAAMGAQPAWCTLSLSLPQVDLPWVDGFLDGFIALAEQHGIALVGGDTTRGPLSISVTAMGRVAAGAALRRDGACVGDDVWVTGTPGDAGAALQLWLQGRLDVTMVAADPAHEQLRQRLLRPVPRVAAGRQLLGVAHSAIDISDGLVADLQHLCARSGVGARIELPALPASAALAALFDQALCQRVQCGGGDDYELCFSAAPAKRDAVLQALLLAGVDATRIGCIVAGSQLHILDAQGATWTPPRVGYQHFAS